MGSETYIGDRIAETLDRTAKEIGVNFIGGYPTLVVKGMTDAERLLTDSIPEAPVRTERVCSSVNVGSTRTGLNMDAVRHMGQVAKETVERTADNDPLGCAKPVIFCSAPDDNPFMAGVFHGVTEGDTMVHVGVSGPSVVCATAQQTKGQGFEVFCEIIEKAAFKITRVGQLVVKEASRRLDTSFGIADLSLAPTPMAGDSVAGILEGVGLESVGAPSTIAALVLLNGQVKKNGVMASSYVDGLLGAFIPVSEDRGMIRAAKHGALVLKKLKAMICVCSMGLGMITMPGDTSAETISGIIAGEAAIGMINQKTTAVRPIPAAGKKVGSEVEFGGLLSHAPVIAVNPYNRADLVKHGDRIPASIHSSKN